MAPRLGVVLLFGLAVLASGAGFASAQTGTGAPVKAKARTGTGAPVKAKAQTGGGAPVKAEATGDGMTVTLTARPRHPRKGAPVHFVATASDEHATGALGRTLTYGDGTDAPPIAMPEFCMAPPGRPSNSTWHFTHRYGAPGRYRVKFQAFVNCGGGHASVSVTVKVHA